MLHNILLQAGIQTEIAKKGKFINVVLAAGEITARIRHIDGGVLETKLISGMAFPVPEGFASVGLTSDVSQQTKVWLGDMPLTYSPSESVVVGSRALSSHGVELYHNQITEILPARNGRGKITLQADKEFHLAGAGGTLNNAIKIPAGELFAFATQGAVFGYSSDVDDIPKRYVEMTEVSAIGVSADYGGKHGNVIYNPITDEVIFSTAAVLYRSPANTLAGRVAITEPFASIDEHTLRAIDGETFEVFGFTGWSLHRVVFSFADYSIISNTELATSNHGSAYHVSISGDKFAWIGGGTGTTCYTGTMDGASAVLVDKSSYPFADWRVVLFNAVGELFFVNNTGTSWAITSDNGATWESGVFSTTLSITAASWSYDSVTGYLYAVASNKSIYVSKNNGRTFSQITSIGADNYSPVLVYSMTAFSGDVYVSASNALYFYKATTDSWLELLLPDIGYYASQGSNGLVYVSGSTSAVLEVVGGVEKAVGGMTLNILEETS